MKIKLLKSRWGIREKIQHLSLAILLLIFVASRIPYIIAYFPGLTIPDTACSIAQFYGIKTWVIEQSTNPDAILSNHHMILLTFLFGGAVKFGELLGHQNIGFCMLVVFQVIFTNLIAAYCFGVFRNKVSKTVYCLVLFFYTVFPIFPLWQIAVSKDTLFAMSLVFFVVLLYELAESKGSLLNDKKFLLKLVLSYCLVIFTKQQGVYIVLATFAVICLVYRKSFIRVVLCCILPVIFYMTVFTGMILPAFNVALSGKQELLGPVFQQTARYVCDYASDVTSEEQEAIAAVLPYDELDELYDPALQDPVKFEFNQNASDEDVSNYLKVWFQMFKKHPDAYFNATIDNIKGFFVPHKPDTYSYLPPPLERSSILPKHDVFELKSVYPQPMYGYVSLYSETLAMNPITCAFFQQCFYVWSSTLICLYLAIRHKFKSVIGLLPILISFLMLVIFPVVDFRYVLMFVFAFPFLILMLFQRKGVPDHG